MPKRIGYLYDKMLDRGFIRDAILDAVAHRHNRRDIAKILADLDWYVEKVYQMLAAGLYIPSRPRTRLVYDESSQKWRKLKIVPFWPDGVIQWVIVSAMKPVLMRGMYHWSCASVPGRGGARVHKRLSTALRRDPKGTRYGAEADIRQYYPSVSVPRLMRMLARKIKDKRFLRLVEAILQTCGGGLGIGYYICQWLANFYLEGLDRLICSLPGVKYYTRHMDNLVLLGPNKRLLHKAIRSIRAYAERELGLTLKNDWQVYRTGFTARVERRRAGMTEKQRRRRKPRAVAAVGYRFRHSHTEMRGRNFLRLVRQCRRVQKRQAAHRPITPHQAGALLSRIGQLRHCDSRNIRDKYITPIGVKTLKEVIRYESKRRLASQQRFLAGGATQKAGVCHGAVF